MRIPETCSYDAVIAGHNSGPGWNFNLSAYRCDAAVTDEHRSVFDRRIAGRDVDSGVLNGESTPTQLQRRVRTMAGVKLNKPYSCANYDEEDQYQGKKTKQPAAHRETSSR